ncbi:hypothetical protein [Dactylococcopsis salina]|uniref:hypothetical protein n=1 Tax=Dactylococcopsis salina TaxID=292566 RepID=UPI0002D86EAA|nr:hypothetical protein [Dactylococcopsis salina]
MVGLVRQEAKGKRQKAKGKRQEARGKILTIEQLMNLHFYLNLIASNPYLVKLSVSQQEALNKKSQL